LFDHRNRIHFESKKKEFDLEIIADAFLNYSVVVLNEKSTARQILTAGFSNSQSKEFLKLEFNDKETGKPEALILDIDYPLETVGKNLDPILYSTQNRQAETISVIPTEPITLACKKCDTINEMRTRFCSTCGEKSQVAVEQPSTYIEPRDYVLSRGEKTQEEIKAIELDRKKKEYEKRLLNPDEVFDVKYLGGHKGFPTKKPRDARIRVFIDRIEIRTDKFEVKIPYLTMTNVENTDERRITTKRWFLVGVWAIAWKKNFVYTVIEYEDEHDTLGLIFDFGKHLESKQGIIYQRMINARSNKSDKFGGFYQ
jgi:hypothetical protein